MFHFTGLNPHALKEQAPAFAGEDLRTKTEIFFARAGGDLPF
jgi:hypothetical protein